MSILADKYILRPHIAYFTVVTLKVTRALYQRVQNIPDLHFLEVSTNFLPVFKFVKQYKFEIIIVDLCNLCTKKIPPVGQIPHTVFSFHTDKPWAIVALTSLYLIFWLCYFPIAGSLTHCQYA
jgi:hypothetical protein